MVFQYESLVGHLFMVNGRTLSTPPPGALVEVAPKKAARGREADTFFVMVMPSGDIASTSFYENMAELAAERYFNSTGSVTAGLRAVYDTLNRSLIDHNRLGKRTYEANMLCAVLHDTNLILSRCGLGVAILRIGDTTHLFPTDPINEEELVYGPPLGVIPMPDVKMKQFNVSQGTRLVLSDSELAEADMNRARSAIVGMDLSEVLVNFRQILIERATLMAVEFVPPEAQIDLLVQEGDNSMEIAKSPTPPEKKIDNVDLEPGLGTRVIDGASAAKDRAQIGVSKASLGLSKGAEITSKTVEHYFGPKKDDDKPKWWSGPLAISVAAVIPLVVVALVLILWVSGVNETEYERCVQEAIQTASIARNIDSGDVNGTLAGWNAVLVKVDECHQMRPDGVADSQLDGLTREGQDIIDRLLVIERREAQPLASFPSATLRSVVLRGLNMYVLDEANSIVYQLQLSGDGRSVVPNTQAPIPNMRRGASVNQYTVGEIFDIAWTEDGSGVSQGNVLVAIDTEGVLIEHSPTILTRGSQRLLGTENWINPVAIQVWRGNLYVLDPGANQIWRYEPTTGSYAGAPTEYFAGQTRPNISNAVDFSIDTNGAVYVLYGDGQMGKYLSGEAQTFGYANFPQGQQLGTANSMYLSNSPLSQGVYVVSQPNRTIYEVTQAGTFMNAYRVYDEENFASLRDTIAEPGQQVIYALSGNTVFAFGKER